MDKISSHLPENRVELNDESTKYERIKAKDNGTFTMLNQWNVNVRDETSILPIVTNTPEEWVMSTVKFFKFIIVGE